MKILSVPFTVKPWYKQLLCRHRYVVVVSRQRTIFERISEMSMVPQHAVKCMTISFGYIYLEKQDILVEITPLTEQCNLCGRDRPALQKGITQ